MQTTEMILKVGDGGRYADGDILVALPRKRIRFVHAAHACDHRKAAFNKAGLRPLDSLAIKMPQVVNQYEYRRVSETEIVRRTLADDTEVTLGPDPVVVDGVSQRIDVPRFIARAIRNPNHALFGNSEAKCRWYGGKVTVDNTLLDTVWGHIEDRTATREATDAQRWPMGTKDCCVHLPVRVERDLTDAEISALHDEDGLPIKKVWISTVVIRSGKRLGDIRNRNVQIDTRDTPIRFDDLEVKSG